MFTIQRNGALYLTDGSTKDDIYWVCNETFHKFKQLSEEDAVHWLAFLRKREPGVIFEEVNYRDVTTTYLGSQ